MKSTLIVALLVCALVALVQAKEVKDELVCRNFFTERDSDKCLNCCTSKGYHRELSLQYSTINAQEGGACVCARTMSDEAEPTSSPLEPISATQEPITESSPMEQ